MGGYIQNIKTAEAYQRFSRVVFEATEKSVYRALAHHLRPHRLKNIDDAETQGRDGKYIHPFEILTIGGDDVMLVVPADQALAIAKTLCEEFENILLELDSNLAIQPIAVPERVRYNEGRGKIANLTPFSSGGRYESVLARLPTKNC